MSKKKKYKIKVKAYIYGANKKDIEDKTFMLHDKIVDCVNEHFSKGAEVLIFSEAKKQKE